MKMHEIENKEILDSQYEVDQEDWFESMVQIYGLVSVIKSLNSADQEII
jgi:hypothetical protein